MSETLKRYFPDSSHNFQSSLAEIKR